MDAPELSPDGRSLLLPDGRYFTLTTSQAAVVRVLLERLAAGQPECEAGWLLETAGLGERERPAKAVLDICRSAVGLVRSGSRRGLIRLSPFNAVATTL